MTKSRVLPVHIMPGTYLSPEQIPSRHLVVAIFLGKLDVFQKQLSGGAP